jgi:[acyl-carrier-protein] S-malonyltransferase
MLQAAVFPGQGAQHVGMGRDVAAKAPAAAQVFEHADRVLRAELGGPLSTLCFEGPAERLNATDVQQPAIFVTGVALFRAAESSGLVRAEQFSFMGGLSLGEYTALHLAGALSFEDALALVFRRGQLMQRACRERPGTMVSVMGLEEARVADICRAAADVGLVAPANFNCPGQIVISGEADACRMAAGLVEQAGGRAQPLKVAGAFHSELMRSAADGLRPVLVGTEFRRPACRVIANVDATYHDGSAGTRESLGRQVCAAVRWQSCVERMIADGCTHFWEFGPGRVLTGLLRKIDRSASGTNVSTVADLQPVPAS